jgi:acetyl/propionyl-CoA carboxylase alpha subunit
MLRALGEYEIDGIETLVPFHRRLLETEQWACGESARDLLADRAWLRATGERDGEPAVETGGRSSARA